MFESKRTSWISFSIPARNGWRGILLLLTRFGKDGKHEAVVPRISQETLAEMVGTTRSRVNVFMNKFRKLGSLTTTGASRFTAPC